MALDMTFQRVRSCSNLSSTTTEAFWTVGPYAIGRSQVVYINDSTILFNSRKPDGNYAGRDHIVEVRFFLDVVDPMCYVQQSFLQPSEILVYGYTGLFGGDLSVISHPTQPPLRFREPDGVPIVRDKINSNGCTPYGQSHDGAAMLLDRGNCTFVEKLTIARAAGAVGVIVISDEDVGINPSASEEDLTAVGDLSDVAILVITRSDGKTVTDMMNSADILGMGELRLALQGQPPLPEEDEEDTSEAKTNRVLYLNGHPLLNTHLLV
jgi:mannosidase alpha-like ER degradation enhancer 1